MTNEDYWAELDAFWDEITVYRLGGDIDDADIVNLNILTSEFKKKNGMDSMTDGPEKEAKASELTYLLRERLSLLLRKN